MKSKRKQGKKPNFKRVLLIGIFLTLSLFLCAYFFRIHGAFVHFEDADAVERFLLSNLEAGQSSTTDVQNFMDSYISSDWKSGRLWSVDSCSEPQVPDLNRNYTYDLALHCNVNAEPRGLVSLGVYFYSIVFYFEHDSLSKIEVYDGYVGL